MPSIAYANKPTRLQAIAMRRSHTTNGGTMQLSLASPPSSPLLPPVDVGRWCESAPTTPTQYGLSPLPSHHHHHHHHRTPPLSPRRKLSSAAKTSAQVSAAQVLWYAADGVSAPKPAVVIRSAPAPVASTSASATLGGMVRSLAMRWTGGVERTVERVQRSNNPAFALAGGWHALAARLLLLRPAKAGQDAGVVALLRVIGTFNAAFSALCGQACWQSSKRSQHSQLAILGVSSLAQGWALLSVAPALRGHTALLRLLAGGNALVAIVAFVYWLRRVLLLRQRRAVQQQKRQQLQSAIPPSITTTNY